MANPKTTTPKSAPKKTATKKVAKTAAKAPVTKAADKRTRKSLPLYAEVSLGKLTELLKGDKNAKVVVSRNFVLGVQEAALKAEAAKSLGL